MSEVVTWGSAVLPIIASRGLRSYGPPTLGTFLLIGSGLHVSLKKQGISIQSVLQKAPICSVKWPNHMGPTDVDYFNTMQSIFGENTSTVKLSK